MVEELRSKRLKRLICSLVGQLNSGTVGQYNLLSSGTVERWNS